MNKNLNRIISKYHTDDNGNPRSIHIVRKHQISPIYNGIQLDDIPDESMRVSVIEPSDIYEVYNADDIVENSFYVRHDGVVLFHKSMAGKEVTIDYHGVGIEKIGADRIYTMVDAKGNIIETLGDVFEVGRIVIDAIKTIGDVVVVLEEIKVDITEANRIQPILRGDIEMATPLEASLRKYVLEGQPLLEELSPIVTEGSRLDVDLRPVVQEGARIEQELEDAIVRGDIPTMKADIINLDSQLSDIENNYTTFNLLSDCKLKLPDDFPYIPFGIYKKDDKYEVNVNAYNVEDWMGAKEIYIQSETGIGDGLTFKSPISLNRFKQNYNSGVYEGTKKFILNITENYLITKEGLVLENEDLTLLIRSRAINGYSVAGRLKGENLGNELTGRWILENGVYKIIQKVNHNVLDIINCDLDNAFKTFTPYIKVNTLEECKLKKGTFYQDGVNIYCNPHLKHQIKKCFLCINSGGFVFNNRMKSKIIFENIIFAPTCFSWNTISECELWAFNCKWYRGLQNAIGLNGTYKAYLFNCIASYGNLDCFNYHSTSINSLVVEINCIGFGAGKFKFQNGDLLTGSNNCSTAHDGMNILRAGCNYYDAEGPIVADVDDSYSINYNVNAFNVLPTTTGRKSAFAFLNYKNKKALLYNCCGGGENVELGVDGDDKTYVYNFNGLKKYNGNINI